MLEEAATPQTAEAEAEEADITEINEVVQITPVFGVAAAPHTDGGVVLLRLDPATNTAEPILATPTIEDTKAFLAQFMATVAALVDTDHADRTDHIKEGPPQPPAAQPHQSDPTPTSLTERIAQGRRAHAQAVAQPGEVVHPSGLIVP